MLFEAFRPVYLISIGKSGKNAFWMYRRLISYVFEKLRFCQSSAFGTVSPSITHLDWKKRQKWLFDCIDVHFVCFYKTKILTIQAFWTDSYLKNTYVFFMTDKMMYTLRKDRQNFCDFWCFWKIKILPIQCFLKRFAHYNSSRLEKTAKVAFWVYRRSFRMFLQNQNSDNLSFLNRFAHYNSSRLEKTAKVAFWEYRRSFSMLWKKSKFWQSRLFEPFRLL